MESRTRRCRRHRRAGGFQRSADDYSGVPARARRNSLRVQRQPPAARLRAGLSDRAPWDSAPPPSAWPGARSATTLPRMSTATMCPRSSRTRWPSCCRSTWKPTTPNKPGASAPPRSSGPALIKLAACPFANVIRKLIPAGRRHDGLRRGHVQLPGAGAAAARFRSAHRRVDSAGDRHHRRPRRRPRHALAHSAVSGGVADPAGRRYRHRLRASFLAGAAAHPAASGVAWTVKRASARSAVFVGDRAHGDLPRAARHRLGGRSQRRRRRIRRARHPFLGRSGHADLRRRGQHRRPRRLCPASALQTHGRAHRLLLLDSRFSSPWW